LIKFMDKFYGRVSWINLNDMDYVYD
jgi:hypothetical protein